jgi:hypothetical protein
MVFVVDKSVEVNLLWEKKHYFMADKPYVSENETDTFLWDKGSTNSRLH